MTHGSLLHPRKTRFFSDMVPKDNLIPWVALILIGLILPLAAGCAPASVDNSAMPSFGATLPSVSVPIDGTPAADNTFANPTATVNFANPNAVQITELEYFQTGTQLQVIAKLQNLYSDAILRDVQLEILALDSSGNRIAQQFRAVKYVFPDETTGLVENLDLQPGLEADSVEVRVNDGIIDRQLRYQQPLKITGTAAFYNESSASLTGWLENQDPYTYTQVLLNAIAYNARGEIIGGGLAATEFVPANDKMGVQVAVTLSETPTVVEIYPWITLASTSLPGGTWWDTISVKDWNFLLTPDHLVIGGAELLNNSDALLAQSFYILTVSDTNGQVCLVDKGSIDYLWPGESLHFSPGILTAPSDSEPKNVDLIIVPGEFSQLPLRYNPLMISQASLSSDEGELFVDVRVINNLNASISETIVYVNLLDENGQIVGGGKAYSAAVNANSAFQVAVPVAGLGNWEKFTITASVTLPQSAQIGQ